MKNLVLNNYHEIDMEKSLRKFLTTNFTENQEIWCHFQTAFWPENRKETKKRFFALESNDNVICRTVFLTWQQLELMILLLSELKKKKIKLNVYISYPDLAENLSKYYNDYESSICPNTKKYDDDPELREQFKKNMNKVFFDMLEYHNVYELSTYHDHILIKSKDIKINEEL